MLVVHCGRGDIILGILTAIQARGFPAVAGILMTGGGKLEPGVESVLDAIEEGEGVSVPIMYVNDDTFNAASNIVNMPRKLAASGNSKVDSAISLFEKFADREQIYSLVTLLEERLVPCHSPLPCLSLPAPLHSRSLFTAQVPSFTDAPPVLCRLPPSPYAHTSIFSLPDPRSFFLSPSNRRLQGH